MHLSGISASLAAFLFLDLQLHPGLPKLHPTTLLSSPLSLPLLTALFSRSLFPTPHSSKLTLHSPVSRFLPRLLFALNISLRLCPTCFLLSLSPGCRLSLPSPCALSYRSHFSFPSAFASVRTLSARLAFNLSAFLSPMNHHPPSGTSACSLSVARSRLFAFRPVSQAQFALPTASLSLAPFRRFPFPSVSFRYSAALSCCLLFQAYRPSKPLFPGSLRALSNLFRSFRYALSNTTSDIIRHRFKFVKHFLKFFEKTL